MIREFLVGAENWRHFNALWFINSWLTEVCFVVVVLLILTVAFFKYKGV